MIDAAKSCGTNCIELYTEDYAKGYIFDKEKSISPYIIAADKAKELDLKVNAGHDLNLENLGFFSSKMNHLDEVSIGHAIVSDALYYGLENTILMYKRLLS